MNANDVSSNERSCIERVRHALAGVTETRVYRQGETLFEQGAPPGEIYFLRSGLIHLHRAAIEQDPRLCVVQPGDVIGVTFAVSGRAYDMDAIAMRPSEVDVVSRDAFLRAMTEIPGLHFEVVRILSLDLGRCYEVLRTLGPKSRQRTAEEGTL
jgi:CRP-like cAMP-binding protein